MPRCNCSLIKIVNLCLDYCSNNISYTCIAFCASSRKNDYANQVKHLIDIVYCLLQRVRLQNIKIYSSNQF